MTGPVLEVQHLSKSFPIVRGLLRRTVAELRAVDDVSLDIQPGETLCIVGESGCGKSTVGRLVLRLLQPSAGRILIEGHDVTELTAEQVRPFRRPGADGVPGSLRLAEPAPVGGGDRHR